MKRLFKWIFYREEDVSALMTFIVMLSLIQLIEVHFSHKLLIIPYAIFLLVVMRLMIELIKRILKQRNVKVSRGYFIAAIFFVIVVTGMIKITLL